MTAGGKPHRRRTRLVVTGVVAAGMLVVAAAPYVPAQEPTGDARGRALFMRDCAWCHGPRGEGTNRGPAIENAGAAGAHFYLSTGRMPIDDPYEEPERSEPAYPPEDVEALVRYVAGLGQGPSIPTVDVADADVARGAHLYLLNCAACHSASGVGATLAGGVQAPALREATPTQVAEAVMIGPGPMPAFDVLADDEVAAIARYVQTLRDPRQRGGASLGFLGPIAEGLVATVVGLGLLLMVIRRIGTTV